METKARENTNTIPIRENASKGVDSLKIKFGGLNITFGAYAQVNISTTNITNQRTVGAIAIRT